MEKNLSVENQDPLHSVETLMPSYKDCRAEKRTFLATGKFNDTDGIFIEWLGTGRIVVRIDGKDYRQTIEEFINNAKSNNNE